jgi:hypothetical protein
VRRSAHKNFHDGEPAPQRLSWLSYWRRHSFLSDLIYYCRLKPTAVHHILAERHVGFNLVVVSRTCPRCRNQARSEEHPLDRWYGFCGTSQLLRGMKVYFQIWKPGQIAPPVSMEKQEAVFQPLRSHTAQFGMTIEENSDL